MHILHVVGARPNFMKAAPVLRALAAKPGVRQTLVHTGQHYDRIMSEVFFQELEMPQPDCNLEVGSGSHAQQTAAVLRAFEPVIVERRPDLVLVYGDVNSTVAAALVCSKLGFPVGHVEAGLRSRDRTMPEEINRLLTDQLSDLLFTPSPDADENLLHEGVDRSRIHLVGNVMIDTLVRLLPQSEQHRRANLAAPYILVTLHRPSNVDDLPWLRELLATLAELSRHLTVVFPIHPRTRDRLSNLTTDAGSHPRLQLLNPQPYLDFLALQRGAALVITDSGGIQEETTFLGVPCLTVRENTERPVTITMGTNQLVGRDLQKLRKAAAEILREELEGGTNQGAIEGGRRESSSGMETRQQTCHIPLWDGHTAERIAEIILRRETSLS
jgi:UDP-N-acetylglucosamine 2-epimerase (non-hydrolysing)